MSENLTALQKAMREKYPQETNDRAKLVIGKYKVTGFEIIPSERYEWIAYLDAKEGKFRTTSRNVVGALRGKVGEVIKEVIAKHGHCELEIIDKKATTGRHGIAIKAF